MKQTKSVVKNILEVDDVICDSCGKSCRNLISRGFEYMILSNHWGYGSQYDGESWEAHVCEECVTTKLEPIIKFNKDAYIL